MPQVYPNPNVQNAQANDIVYPEQGVPNQGHNQSLPFNNLLI